MNSPALAVVLYRGSWNTTTTDDPACPTRGEVGRSGWGDWKHPAQMHAFQWRNKRGKRRGAMFESQPWHRRLMLWTGTSVCWLLGNLATPVGQLASCFAGGPQRSPADVAGGTSVTNEAPVSVVGDTGGLRRRFCCSQTCACADGKETGVREGTAKCRATANTPAEFGRDARTESQGSLPER